VENRAASPAHRREMTVDILGRVSVKEAMTTQVTTVDPKSSIRSVIDLIHENGHTAYPVVEDGKLVGIVTFEDLEEVPMDKRQDTQVKEVMTVKVIVARPDDTLESALKRIVDRDVEKLPVVDSQDPTKLVGLISTFDIVRTHAKLSAQR
jgi:CIC family chloride channel protein